MRIRNWKNFTAGTIIGLFSIVPFSYMNHADKFQIQNCDKLIGTVSEVQKQAGWLIGLKEYEFKVRIVGEYLKSLDHDAFGQFVKTDAVIEILLVKPSEFGLFEKINQNNGIRDAAGIKVNGVEVLSITKLNDRLSILYGTNLAFGLVVIGLGLLMIYYSTK